MPTFENWRRGQIWPPPHGIGLRTGVFGQFPSENGQAWWKKQGRVGAFSLKISTLRQKFFTNDDFCIFFKIARIFSWKFEDLMIYFHVWRLNFAEFLSFFSADADFCTKFVENSDKVLLATRIIEIFPAENFGRKCSLPENLGSI